MYVLEVYKTYEIKNKKDPSEEGSKLNTYNEINSTLVSKVFPKVFAATAFT